MIFVLMIHVLIGMMIVMIIRTLTYMYSFWDHPYLIWTILLCSHICLAIM